MVKTVDEHEVALYADFDNRFGRRDERFGIDRAAVKALPVVDISPFLNGGAA